MVSLSNQARLLAAQAFNKQVLERKARERQADIDRERREDLLRTTRRRTASLASARNPVEAQRIRDSISETLRSQAERTRRRKINAEANRKSANVFTRVSKGANIGVLTGFEARKDSRGRAIGISKRESKTRLQTKTFLRNEIARQKKIAREGTDLERFLSNERAINQGRVSRSQLNKQIADRKRRGLSKTPAQKRASQFFRDEGLSTALRARARRKGQPALRASFGQAVSERARAQRLGSDPFADPRFTFGGRTKAEQVARGGTFGRRAGGESISDQLAFIGQAKSRSTSARIGFAQGLLANLNFEGSSQSSLLSIVGNKKIKTPKTFQAELREGVGFFTTEAIPVTKAKLTKGARGTLVARRKAEDFAKATEARKELRKQERGFVLARSRRPPSIFSVQALQAQDPTEISFLPTRSAFVGQTARVAKGETLTPAQKRAKAEATQRETELLRATPFQVGGLVQATGRPSSTETFFPSVPIDEGNIFNVNLREQVGIGDVLSPTPRRAPTKKRPRKPTTQRVDDGFGIFDLSSLIALDAPDRQRVGTTPRQPAPPRETGGILDFLSLDGGFDVGAGFGSESLGAEFSFGETFEASIPFLTEPFR